MIRILLLACLALLVLAPDPAHAQGQAPDAGALLRQTERDREPLVAPPLSPNPGLTVAPSPARAASSAADAVRVTVRSFAPGGNRLLSEAELQSALAPWTGRPVTLSELREATAAIEQQYRDRGWLAQAHLPPQDVSAGRVRIEIVEARMGRVEFTPDSAAIGPRLLGQVRLILESDLPAGRPLNLRRLERSLLIAGALPGVTVGGSLQAGRVTASTDLLVSVRRASRRHAELAADNGGNRATGAARVNAQITGESLLDAGERMNLGLAVTEGSRYLGADVSAPLPLAVLADARIGVHASALSYRVLPSMNTSAGLAPRGHTESAGATIEYPLVRTPMASLTARLGYDRRQVVDENSSADPHALAPANASRADIASLGLSGSAYDHAGGGGSTQGGVTLVSGHLDLGASPPGHVAADAATAHTQGGYTILRWSASRLQSLPADFSLLVSAQGQQASTNLDAAEKLYLGGMNGVRAYPSGEAGGASGWQLNLELRKSFGANWLASAFVDRGQVQAYEHNRRADGNGPLLAVNGVALMGRGLALEYRGARGQFLRVGVARRSGSNPLATPAGNDSDGSRTLNRVWISAGIAFQ